MSNARTKCCTGSEGPPAQQLAVEVDLGLQLLVVRHGVRDHVLHPVVDALPEDLDALPEQRRGIATQPPLWHIPRSRTLKVALLFFGLIVWQEV